MLEIVNRNIEFDADIENIYTLILNPKYHFHFLGMKCFDITASSRRLISRSTALSFIDIFLLKKFTNIDFLKEFCLKNISRNRLELVRSSGEHYMKSYATGTFLLI